MNPAAPAVADLALDDQQLGIVWKVLQAHLPGVPVWVFGSRARGQAKPFSDLDLALMTEQPLAWDQLADLQEAFSTSDLPFRVDLVDWASAQAGFKSVIASQGRALPTAACLTTETTETTATAATALGQV